MEETEEGAHRVRGVATENSIDKKKQLFSHIVYVKVTNISTYKHGVVM